MSKRRTGRLRGIIFSFLFAWLAEAASAIDVKIDVPTVQLHGALRTIADLSGSGITDTLNEELRKLSDDLTTEIRNDPDLNKFSNQPLLTRGFANAGSAASHLGTQRAFTDYDVFALVVGTGASITGPGIDMSALENAAADIETKGDIYLGAAIQPITVSLGINLSRWVPRTRADLKVGYANISKGTLDGDFAFSAFSVGAGIGYQVLQSRQLPLGFIRWRGLTLASGLIYQRNDVTIEINVSDGDYETTFITFGDLGFTDAELLPLPGIDSATEFGTLSVQPTLGANVVSRTYTIPLEATTGFRILWILDVNVGVGVDLVFGSSDIVLGASTDAVFKTAPEAAPYVTTTPGTAAFGIRTSEGPQFLRPRLTAGVGLNLGPVKLDIPVMLYFDDDGNSLMAGVNLGIVW